MSYTPSRYQQAIFNWIQNGSGNAVVEAVAGSGKTTTAVSAMGFIPPSERVLFLAFNKSIAEELSKRIPFHCQAKTLNGLGHGACMQFFGKLRLDSDKVKRHLGNEIEDPQLMRMFGAVVRQLIGLAKANGIVPKDVPGAQGLVEDTNDTWFDLIRHYDLPITADYFEQVVSLCRRVLSACIRDTASIDFDDQLYFPVIYGMGLKTYDWVFIDEAQDLNPIQHALVSKTGTRGRIVAIGDSRQAIYGFRGASSDSMEKFRTQFNAETLPLSICYRCPKSHVRLAQSIVPTIEAAPTAKEGEIMTLGNRWDGSTFASDDLIICRSTAPLVRVAYRLLSQGVPVRIMGRDIGEGLIALIKNLKPYTLDDLVYKLGQWHSKEVSRLLGRNPDASTDKLDDKYETLMTFVDMFPNHSPAQITVEIQNLYADKTNILTLATVHKSKGLEARRVFVLNRYLLGRDTIGDKILKDWQVEQEMNLAYVAYTRAKEFLGFIEIENRRRG